MDLGSCVYQNFLDGKVTKFSLVWSSVKKAQQAGEDCIARAYPCYSVMINLKNSKSHGRDASPYKVNYHQCGTWVERNSIKKRFLMSDIINERLLKSEEISVPK